MSTPLDLEAITAEFLQQCGPCDFGVDSTGCNCPKRDYRPTMRDLVDEVERLRLELVVARAEVTHKASDPGE